MRVGNSPLAPARLWLLLAGAFCCCSCSSDGPPLYPVQGKVLLKGQPLAGATVTFRPKQGDPKQLPSTGFTDDDGSFHLETGKRAGAPAGDYDIIIIQSRPVAAKSDKAISMEPQSTIDALHGAYATPAKSRLTATVKAGSNELPPFDLK